jgi:phage gp36-like protein
VAYAQPADLVTVGLLRTALGPLQNDQVLAALQNASDTLDSYFRGRYGDGPSPLLKTWDTQVTRAVARMAAYELMDMRGVDPDKPNPWIAANLSAIQWCKDVEHSQAHPLVTVWGTPLAGSQQPIVTSYSVTQVATGKRAPNRGW